MRGSCNIRARQTAVRMALITAERLVWRAHCEAEIGGMECRTSDQNPTQNTLF